MTSLDQPNAAGPPQSPAADRDGSDASKPTPESLPNLLLAGIGRAGSSSLFWYLSQHPDICASSVKEPRYFLPLSEADEDATGSLGSLDGYTRLFDRCSAEPFRMEATPHYFNGGGRLVDGIRRSLPDPHVILTLRDPVTRTWSIYRAAMSILQIPKDLSFERYIDRSEQLYLSAAKRTPDNRPYWSIRGAVYADYLPAWFERFADDRLRVQYFEDIVADPPGVVAETCRWLGLDDSGVSGFRFSVENRTLGFRNKTLHRVALIANRQGLLRERRRLKAPLRALYQALNMGSQQEKMSDDARARLKAIFAEPNQRLASLLAGRGYRRLPSWLADGDDN